MTTITQEDVQTTLRVLAELKQQMKDGTICDDKSKPARDLYKKSVTVCEVVLDNLFVVDD